MSSGRRCRHDHTTPTQHRRNPRSSSRNRRRLARRAGRARASRLQQSRLSGCGSSSTTTSGRQRQSVPDHTPPSLPRRRPRRSPRPGRSGPPSTATWSRHSTGPVSRRRSRGTARAHRATAIPRRLPVRPGQRAGVRLSADQRRRRSTSSSRRVAPRTRPSARARRCRLRLRPSPSPANRRSSTRWTAACSPSLRRVIHAGRVYAFFTFDQPGKEAEMRAWFGSLIQAVAFDM